MDNSFIASYDITDRERNLVGQVQPYTMTTPARVVALKRGVELIVQRDIQGAIVECGVWRGGSMMAVAMTLLNMHAEPRDLFLFDTFDGMPPPGEFDISFDGISAERQLAESDRKSSKAWAVSTLQEVQHAMNSTGYPSDRIFYVEGKVEDTLPNAAPHAISLLRLDTDWYESTYHELQTLYPRLTPGGVLIIDDYGHWQGCRRAVDQYFQENDLDIRLQQIDYTGRIAIKPD